jgi:hypothetical protein
MFASIQRLQLAADETIMPAFFFGSKLLTVCLLLSLFCYLFRDDRYTHSRSPLRYAQRRLHDEAALPMLSPTTR